MAKHMSKDEIVARIAQISKDLESYKAGLYADNQIDRDETEGLQQVNDAFDDLSDRWVALFKAAMTDSVLGDPKSPNEVDEDEAKHIQQAFTRNGNVGVAERAALAEILSRSPKMPPAFKVWAQKHAV